MDTPANQRDDRGRFSHGNSGGPGRPRGRSNALRRAAEEAVTPEHIAAIMRRAARMALEGNMAAMRLVLERTCGRPVEAPSEGVPLDVKLPHLRTAKNCTRAIDHLVESICLGTVNRDSATMLLDVIQTRLKAIEVNDLADRLEELENATSMVEDGSQQMRRV